MTAKMLKGQVYGWRGTEASPRWLRLPAEAVPIHCRTLPQHIIPLMASGYEWGFFSVVVGYSCCHRV